jgi:protein TonB
MPRLRTTASLSLLALLVGIGGTTWLSGQTAGWAGPPAHAARWPVYRRAVAIAAPVARPRPRSHAPWLAVQPTARRVREDAAVAQAAPPAPVELVPVAMPSRPVPYQAMRRHLDGQVLLRLRVDGQGRVADAAVAVSSGDAVLDAHALDTVRGWRFAVPPGHPDGLGGELPMRFTLGDDRRLAQAP